MLGSGYKNGSDVVVMHLLGQSLLAIAKCQITIFNITTSKTLFLQSFYTKF